MQSELRRTWPLECVIAGTCGCRGTNACVASVPQVSVPESYNSALLSHNLRACGVAMYMCPLRVACRYLADIANQKMQVSWDQWSDFQHWFSTPEARCVCMDLVERGLADVCQPSFVHTAKLCWCAKMSSQRICCRHSAP